MRWFDPDTSVTLSRRTVQAPAGTLNLFSDIHQHPQHDGIAGTG
jgi:hypothetical protein